MSMMVSALEMRSLQHEGGRYGAAWGGEHGGAQKQGEGDESGPEGRWPHERGTAVTGNHQGIHGYTNAGRSAPCLLRTGSCLPPPSAAASSSLQYHAVSWFPPAQLTNHDRS